ncbi:MAG: diaminopropionate ammonia-lyase, partial [Alphaproteobacteria bacterium]|nr:diaminopropionate ammonia-lyase [Alphaproteobacteria bacterium]
MKHDHQTYERGLKGAFKNTCRSQPTQSSPYFDPNGMLNAQSIIKKWPEYKETRLISLPSLSRHLNINSLSIKHEGDRFGLGTFKALGGRYAIEQLLKNGDLKKGDTVTCATDGNHGRGVAWAAKNLGLKAVVYMPSHVSLERSDYIERLGATVIRINGNYEDALKECTNQSNKQKWILISDTATNEDVSVPRLIMNSYSIIADEALNQMELIPSHVFVSAGVGGLAATMTEYFLQKTGLSTQVITVEPHEAACILNSLENGKISTARGSLDTVMGCLACSYPATLAWEILHRHAGGAISISEDAAKAALKDLAQGNFGDSIIEGGESGIAAFAGFLSLLHSFNQRTTFDINTKSDILVLLTEGPTDPKKFEKIVGRAPLLSYS